MTSLRSMTSPLGGFNEERAAQWAGFGHGGAAAVIEAQRGHFVIASRASSYLFERETV